MISAIYQPPPAGWAPYLRGRSWVAVACIIALTAIGWLYVALLTVRMDGIIAALCRPTFGTGEIWAAGDMGLVAAMWAAMVLAMMLPSAAPMILTYAEIADTAARKGERIVSPFVIAAVTAWFGLALRCSRPSRSCSSRAWPCSIHGIASASALFSGAIFIGAGLYQFSALKHACLTQCRQPFHFLRALGDDAARRVPARSQAGLFCLGCCWAMMLVMFAVGT